ncbi:MAG: hypothetical protein M3Q81_00070 [bacterium]|nr:hypothetical protein [bacterium]
MLKKNIIFPTNSWQSLLILVLVINSILALFLYFIKVKPLHDQVLQLEQALSLTTTFSSPLIESRLILTDMTNINPLLPPSGNLLSSMIERLDTRSAFTTQNLSEKNSDWQKAVEKITPNGNHLTLASQHQKLNIQQETISSELKRRFVIVDDLLLYNPEDDLQTQELPDKSEALLTRVKAAQSGLKNIVEKLSPYETENTDLIKQLERSLLQLTVIETAINTNQYTQAENTTLSFVQDFADLKTVSYVFLITPIQQRPGVEVVLAQGNLIDQYQELVTEINTQQKDIKERNIFIPVRYSLWDR